MSGNNLVPPIENEHVSSPTTQSVEATKSAANAGAAAQANKAPNSATKIADVGELQAKAPELWNQFLQSLGMTICRQWQTKNDDIRRMMRESNETIG